MIYERPKTIMERVYECDLCKYETTYGGCCGVPSVTKCSFCKEVVVCKSCRKDFYDDLIGDYLLLTACVNCRSKAEEAWEWAEENAGRYEGLDRVAMKYYTDSVDP